MYIQIFLHNVKSGEINSNNNHPLLFFSSEEKLIEFLNELKYVEDYDLIKDKTHFVINNPYSLHSLPEEIQNIHNKSNIYYELNENLELMKKQNIENNSHPTNSYLNIGFSSYLKKI
jgi:hypothetical protein